jgi:hypothetical protein
MSFPHSVNDLAISTDSQVHSESQPIQPAEPRNSLRQRVCSIDNPIERSGIHAIDQMNATDTSTSADDVRQYALWITSSTTSRTQAAYSTGRRLQS